MNHYLNVPQYYSIINYEDELERPNNQILQLWNSFYAFFLT